MDLAIPADDPVRALAGVATPSAIAFRRALEVERGGIVSLVVLGSAGGIGYVLATGQA